MTEPKHCDEPMYLISESELNELESDSSEDTYGCTDGIEIAERVRARGPVQQAPASTTLNASERIRNQANALSSIITLEPNTARN